MTDLITRYQALPAGLTMAQSAAKLGVGMSTLALAKKQAALTVDATALRVARFSAILERYNAIPVRMTVAEASRFLGVEVWRLNEALRWAAKAAREVAAPPLAGEPSEAAQGRSQEPLRAGHPDSWGVSDLDERAGYGCLGGLNVSGR